MINARRQIHLFLLIIVAAGAISCGSTRQANIQRGTGYNFKAGFPEFRTSAFGYIDQNQGPMLEITAEIVKGSLIYKQQGDSLTARIAVDLQVINRDSAENIISNKHIEKTISSTNKEITSTRDLLELKYNMQVDPGNFKIAINVKDLNSGKNLSQTTTTYIPQVETGAYTLSSIQMFGKQIGDQNWNSIHTYDVKGKIDSLRFVFQVISEKTDKQMQLDSRLVRFKSDTGYTRPMHYSNFSPSSIEYKGIDYDEETVLQSNRRVLTEYSSIFIEYKFANQERGNYRFEVTAKKGEEESLYKARDFGVKSKNYPAIGTTREMARPLVYLMGEDEYKDLLATSDPDTLKKKIDRFWLKNIGNSTKAADVIEMYYNRVEQANKQFSNFKEGWKTDLGMIYVLFGTPWYTRDRLKQLTWYYSYNQEDPEYSYRFYQPKLKNEFFPFYHYLLERHNYYYTVQYMQRQLWLTGQILTRQL